MLLLIRVLCLCPGVLIGVLCLRLGVLIRVLCLRPGVFCGYFSNGCHCGSCVGRFQQLHRVVTMTCDSDCHKTSYTV